ncbi:hypothetical protein BDF19DRAFT_447955 [Syncephalis fuscata]|nr:hypothetical protein BDF19DRAFT_447955 [Syncephalis fuscata]
MSDENDTALATQLTSRGIYAKALLAAGTVVLTEPAAVAVLYTKTLANYCSHCFCNDSSLRRCTGCERLYYCSTTCQRADWKLHKRECTALRKLNTKTLADAPTRAMARLLRLQHSDPLLKMIFHSLVGHRQLQSATTLESYTRLSLNVAELIDTAELPGSATDLIEYWCRFGCNSHAILDAELEDVGVGIYPAIVRSLHTIDKNEELTINYIDVTMPTTTRQHELKMDTDICEALQCPKQCGGFIQQHGESTNRCNQCDSSVESSQLNRITDLIDKTRLSQSDESMDDTKLAEIHTIYKRHLVLEHHLRRKAAQQRYTRALTSSEWPLAYEMAQELLDAYQSLLLVPRNGNIRLYAAAKLAIMCIDPNNDKPANIQQIIALLNKAWDAARHTHQPAMHNNIVATTNGNLARWMHQMGEYIRTNEQYLVNLMQYHTNSI